jgi:MoaA/NifB/PqqE/SkfB family radical SAM enzyme
MSIDTFRKVLYRYDSIKNIDLASLGETLLYPHFREVFAESAQEFAAVGTTTNGLLLNEFPEILSVPGCLTVSIDSLKTPRPGLDGERIWKNLQDFAKMPRNPSRAINLNMVVLAWNVDEIPTMIDEAGRLGLTSISILRAVHLAGTPVAQQELPPNYPGVQEAIEAGRERWPQLMIVDFFRYFDGGETISNLGSFEGDPWNHPAELKLRLECNGREWSNEFAACRTCYVREGTGIKHTKTQK